MISVPGADQRGDGSPRPFRLIQISDPHLSARRPFFQHNFEVLLERLGDEKADCIVCTGDMTIDGADHPEELVFARRQIERIGLEILFVPGNHDIGNSLPDVRGGEITISAERRRAYRSVFGRDFWTRDIGGVRLVGLNTMLPGSGLPDDAAQEALLTEAVAGLGTRHLVMLGHKPLYLSEPAESLQTQGAMFPEHRRKWANTLNGLPCLYLSGHLHEEKRASWGAIEQCWAPSTAFVMDADNRHTRPDRPTRVMGTKRTGYLRHEFADGVHSVAFVEPTGFLITDLGNWFSDPRGFHARYADEPWRGDLTVSGAGQTG